MWTMSLNSQAGEVAFSVFDTIVPSPRGIVPFDPEPSPFGAFNFSQIPNSTQIPRERDPSPDGRGHGQLTKWACVV